ncbi:rarab: Retinoic acid receptor alpha-B [Crotalus adamanteus]|uniref:Rarab: Retinoic acid receptor alpha-B n=1 Tax=Crotalus adamanteus TaxID=8729 RepID=A0AAW1B4N4_CROAD
MYESVEVAGLNSSPNSFFMMDFYNQNRACLIQDKGAVNPNPYSTPVRNQHWNSSNHCTYNVILWDLTVLS